MAKFTPYWVLNLSVTVTALTFFLFFFLVFRAGSSSAGCTSVCAMTGALLLDETLP